MNIYQLMMLAAEEKLALLEAEKNGIAVSYIDLKEERKNINYELRKIDNKISDIEVVINKIENSGRFFKREKISKLAIGVILFTFVMGAQVALNHEINLAFVLQNLARVSSISGVLYFGTTYKTRSLIKNTNLENEQKKLNDTEEEKQRLKRGLVKNKVKRGNLDSKWKDNSDQIEVSEKKLFVLEQNKETAMKSPLVDDAVKRYYIQQQRTADSAVPVLEVSPVKKTKTAKQINILIAME